MNHHYKNTADTVSPFKSLHEEKEYYKLLFTCIALLRNIETWDPTKGKSLNKVLCERIPELRMPITEHGATTQRRTVKALRLEVQALSHGFKSWADRQRLVREPGLDDDNL